MTPGTASSAASPPVIGAATRRAPDKRKQAGQALVYGLFIMTGGLAALFFLFNTGQLSGEKTKLVNTADAVAYSAGLMHARTLNFLAYTNRAMLANTVSIAQLVSLSSWNQYADMTAMMGKKLGDPVRYPSYYPSYIALQSRSGDGQQARELQEMAEQADREIQDLLVQGQNVASSGLALLRQQVMDEVARANYRGGQDGAVIAESMHRGTDPYQAFVQRYADNDRGRFAELAQVAAKRDSFQDKRSWRLDALMPECSAAAFRNSTDWIERRGGTELLGFDEWKAIDDISEHFYYARYKGDPCTGRAERVSGTGGQSAADAPTLDPDPRHYDWSSMYNSAATPMAMAQSTSSAWAYSGLPAFHDLSEDILEKDDPTLLFPVRLRRSPAETATSEGRSPIRTTPRLNNYRAQAAGNELVAVSTSKVYFRRPAYACAGFGGASRRNCSNSRSGARELASLFNPYWQVGLVQDNSPAVARSMQGVSLP